MTEPNDQDPWADLYADLGVESPPASTPPPAKADPLAELPGDGDEFADGEGGDEEGDEEGDGEPGSADDEPGTKRRRRRRRRRKKKGPGEGVEAEAPAAVAPRVPGLEPEEAEGFDDEAEPEEAAPAEEDEAAEVGSESDAPYDDREETTPDAAREMIAGWDVPSWSQIVAGLYRPER